MFIRPDIIARWRRQFVENAAGVFEKRNGPNSEAEARIAELERVPGNRPERIRCDWFAGCWTCRRAASTINRSRRMKANSRPLGSWFFGPHHLSKNLTRLKD